MLIFHFIILFIISISIGVLIGSKKATKKFISTAILSQATNSNFTIEAGSKCIELKVVSIKTGDKE